jgi:biotin carboxyl carrier protein
MTATALPPRHRMSPGQRLLFFTTAWLIVLMPFLFWWSTWFGRNLSDKKLSEYLQDDAHPRHIQHALVQVGERMAHGDHSIGQWYPRIVQLASYRVEEVRNTDAWVMGQDNSVASFHEALLQMLSDPSPVVRGNAALSLVRFGDATGRPQLVALLQPATVMAPEAGTVTDAALPGAAIHQGGIVLKLNDPTGNKIEVRAPFSGRLRTVAAREGQAVQAGAEVAVEDPGTEQVWEALRALYLVGQSDDLPAIQRCERDLPDNPDRIRQQATETEAAIRGREIK